MHFTLHQRNTQLLWHSTSKGLFFTSISTIQVPEVLCQEGCSEDQLQKLPCCNDKSWHVLKHYLHSLIHLCKCHKPGLNLCFVLFPSFSHKNSWQRYGNNLLMSNISIIRFQQFSKVPVSNVQNIILSTSERSRLLF